MLNPEIIGIVREWSRRTKAELLRMAKKFDVEDSGDLQRTMEERVYQNGNRMTAELEMQVQGRFTDMGVSRGIPASSAQENTSLFTRRVKKPWYSSTYYGRINTLYSVLSFSVIEEVMRKNDSLKNAN